MADPGVPQVAGATVSSAAPAAVECERDLSGTRVAGVGARATGTGCRYAGRLHEEQRQRENPKPQGNWTDVSRMRTISIVYRRSCCEGRENCGPCHLTSVNHKNPAATVAHEFQVHQDVLSAKYDPE